ncbi:MAG: hypothetical protein Kow0098_19680 [Ignavibacteriaceae bacterium]
MRKSLCIILFLFASAGLSAQTGSDKISLKLADQISAAAPGTEFHIWIFFTDKGEQIDKYFINPELVVSRKSIERRTRVLGKNASPVSLRDLPVYSPYLKQVLSTGFQKKHMSRWFNGVSGYATYTEIETIADLPFVKKIDLVHKFKSSVNPELNPDKPGIPDQENIQPDLFSFNYGPSFTQLNQINVPAVHNLGFYGEGVTICVMDAGFNRLSHEVFNNMNIIAAWDFVNNDPNVGDEGDMGSGSHGTQTLSVIGGFKEGQLIGPAFGADFILAKTENTDSETPVEEDNWIAALEWADSIGVDVTSTSLSYLDYDPPYQSYTWEDMDGNTALITIAGDIAAGLGIVVVNSAGNYGYNANHNTLGAPADGDSIIAVGAVESNGQRAGFSSVGPTVDGRIKPDVMAMGSGVIVASPYDDNGYLSSSGTSFSCPLTAGVAALILCYNPSLNPMQVREALRNTASRNSNPDNLYGWGIIDGLAALNYYTIPVELTSFSAAVEKNRVILSWETKTETNTLGFQVQFSEDKITFSDIAFLQAAGNSTTPLSYNFESDLPFGERFFYRLKIIDLDGSYEFSKTIEVSRVLPPVVELYQNYPNPFNPSTTISYSLPERSNVKIELFNILGQRISTLFNGSADAGLHSLKFDSGNIAGGVYLVGLFTGSKTRFIKINLLK